MFERVRVKGFRRVFFESETVDSNNVLIVSGGRSNGVQCLRCCVFKSVTNQLLEPSEQHLSTPTPPQTLITLWVAYWLNYQIVKSFIVYIVYCLLLLVSFNHFHYVGVWGG